MFHLLRYLFLVLLCTAAHILSGCTAFTVTQGGRTLIGNNEDAWSINPQVRYEQGRDGHYGAIYFGHYNGSPLRTMTDQLGMNEAGLVFDGLSIPLVHAPAKAGLRSAPLDALLKQVMHTCADVGEAAALLRTYDMSMIPHAMLFLADKHGGWLIVENDTIMQGHDPWYAVGNWRMSTCTDPSTIPIPRLQQGRQLLSAGSGTSLEEARDVLARMAVCRKKMGEGTLFSTLFDPAEGQVHLYFYHDFSEGITFNLKDELAKGDRTVEMASLFGPRPEFERLANYITPFHQRWLFWGMLGWMVLAGIMGTWSAVTFVRLLFKRTERRGLAMVQALMAGVCCALVIGLLGVLLMQEGVYYFGLGEVDPLLAWLPITLVALKIAVVAIHRIQPTHRWTPTIVGAVIAVPLMIMLGYWGLWWP